MANGHGFTSQDCEHGKVIGECVECELQDVNGQLSDALKEVAHLNAMLKHPMRINLGGGRIALHPDKVGLYPSLCFAHYSSGGVGESFDLPKDRTDGYRLIASITFENPESVDVLVNQLTQIKATFG